MSDNMDEPFDDRIEKDKEMNPDEPEVDELIPTEDEPTEETNDLSDETNEALDIADDADVPSTNDD